jgi:RNA polymerase sigma factor (sigma-70 family)
MSGSGPNTHQGQPKLLAIAAGTAASRSATDSNVDRSGWVAALFAAHNRALLRFLTCRLKSSQEAKEVAQEAYVRMLRLDAPDGVGYLRAFLFKTAANLAADRLKSAARRERIDQLEFFDDVQCEPSPEQGLSAEQELQAILQILDELPARCRYAFVMHRFHGNSIAEVASSMNLSVRTIQLYVERALVFCRDRLRESSGGRNE